MVVQALLRKFRYSAGPKTLTYWIVCHQIWRHSWNKGFLLVFIYVLYQCLLFLNIFLSILFEIIIRRTLWFFFLRTRRWFVFLFLWIFFFLLGRSFLTKDFFELYLFESFTFLWKHFVLQNVIQSTGLHFRSLRA